MARARKRQTAGSASGTQRDPARPFSFLDGMQTLTDALADSLQEHQIRLNTAVVRLQRTSAGWTVTTRSAGREERANFDMVIFTAPLYRLSSLEIEPACDLTPLTEVAYPPLSLAIIVTMLEGPGSGKAAIEEVYHHIVRVLAHTTPPRGCLVVNSAIELAPHDPEIAQWIAESVERTQQAFYYALTRAYQQGEIPIQGDLTALARFLTASLQSLNVTAKAVKDVQQLQDIATVALSVLS